MARTMRLRAALFLWVLLQLSGQIHAAEASENASGSAEAPPAQTIKPTRESIYQHLTKELEAALGAEQHIKEVFAGVAEGMRDSVRNTVIPSLQALVDGVLQATEDAWVAADDAGRTVAVKPCVDGADYDAQQVAKRALEKVEGCIQAVEEEGQRRVREASRLLNDIEDVSKRFVTTLEACIKEEEAKEAAPPSADSSVDPAPETDVATEAPGNCPKAPAEAPGQGAEPAAVAGEKSTRRPKVKDPKAEEPTTAQEGVVEVDAGAKQKCKGSCSKRKKSPEGEEASKAEASEEDVSQVDTKEADETEKVSAQEKAVKHGKEHKGKKGKDWKDNKGKDKSGKWKDEHSANTDETVEGKGAEKSKDGAKGKGKHKKGKDVDAVEKTDKEGVREGKKIINVDSAEYSNTEGNSGEVKDKKGKKSDKKEGKGKKDKGEESGEGGKSRKKRDLLALNEVPEADPQPQASAAPKPAATSDPQQAEAEAEAPTREPWPTEGSTPEERRVITCLRSLTIKPLIDEKTRAYQRLQAVLQRTAAKQQDAPACVTDHVRKAELKISALKQRLASCADRKMRQEL